jgi:hypothetical protein
VIGIASEYSTTFLTYFPGLILFAFALPMVYPGPEVTVDSGRMGYTIEHLEEDTRCLDKSVIVWTRTSYLWASEPTVVYALFKIDSQWRK